VNPPAEFELEITPAGWTVGRFPALQESPGLAHAITTRRGPTFSAPADSPANRVAGQDLAAALGLSGIAWSHQVHGGRVIRARSAGEAGEGDGLVTDVADLGVLGRSADCPLVLVAGPASGPERDPEHLASAVGMAHASWRSTVSGITGRLIEVLQISFGLDPGRMVAGICPSAGPCCYTVGGEVREAALARLGPSAAAFFAVRDDALYLDLWQANVAQLLSAGLLESQIHVAGICTLCRNDLFPSYRREGDSAARFAAVIAMK
jgi:YfiH family protein